MLSDTLLGYYGIVAHNENTLLDVPSKRIFFSSS